MRGLQHENEISSAVVDGALRVHRALGPGLLESVYELAQRGLRVERQVPIPIESQSVPLGEGFRADLIIQGKVLLQLKSVEHLTSLHR
jgi:GxxExxY protein